MEERRALIEAAADQCSPPKADRGRPASPCRRDRRRQRHVHAGSRGRRLDRDPARLVRLHGRRLRKQRMGGAAAALRAFAIRADHGDEPARRPKSRSSMPASRPRASIQACRASGSRRIALHPRLRRARLGRGEGPRPAALGEKLLVPGHCDPTINLYDWYVCIRGVVAELWPITARGAL